jgi:outer membrane protein assembly factor BamD
MFLALGLGLGLSGCAIDPATQDQTLNWTADRLYAEAKDEMAAGNWAQGLILLQKLESRYPFGRYAQQAQIDTAYAHWKEGEPALALAAVERFLRLYPNHENVDYVLYLKGLINFNDRASLFTTVSGEDMAERDPKAAREAFDTFKELVSRFPDSRYAADSAARLQFLINVLAQNDVHVARYYLRRGAFLAGVNRAQQVVKQYQEAPAVEEALAQMMFGYQQLRLEKLADDTRRVLQTNYPQSLYLKHRYDPKERMGLQASVRPDEKSIWSSLKVWEKLPGLLR